MTNNKLIHPPEEVRKKSVGRLKGKLDELRHARTLNDVALRLVDLYHTLNETAAMYGMKLDPLLRCHDGNRSIRSELIAQAGKESANLITQPMPTRTRYSAAREAILEYAKKHDTFTVDDLVALKIGTRRSLSANLHTMAKHRKILVCKSSGAMGCKGEPAVYSLRR